METKNYYNLVIKKTQEEDFIITEITIPTLELTGKGTARNEDKSLRFAFEALGRAVEEFRIVRQNEQQKIEDKETDTLSAQIDDLADISRKAIKRLGW